MYYNKHTGIQEKSSKLKRKLTLALSTAGVLVAGVAAPTFAANDYCGASANGCAHSQANTQCAGHGAFGAFGKDNNWAGGANGDATAYNNSTLCGNPNPNSSAATLGDH
jgi:hypothetical protein